MSHSSRNCSLSHCLTSSFLHSLQRWNTSRRVSTSMRRCRPYPCKYAGFVVEASPITGPNSTHQPGSSRRPQTCHSRHRIGSSSPAGRRWRSPRSTAGSSRRRRTAIPSASSSSPRSRRRAAVPCGRRRGCRCASSGTRSEEHTSELQSHLNLVCRLLLEKKKKKLLHVLVLIKKIKKKYS